LFMNTVDTVIVYNRELVPEKMLLLSLGTKEQGIDLDIEEFAQALVKDRKFVYTYPDEDIKKKENDDGNEFKIKATNVGPKTRQ
ncbi:MAG TPA: hypothetical protein VEP90_14755, partial [Methylomirabilota bacterium]|nr:hypothetical protein [Methylomirabilota bacterium]